MHTKSAARIGILLLTISTAASAASPYKCHINWNLLTDGPSESDFILKSSETEIDSYPQTRVVVSGGHQSSRVQIYQYYGDKKQNYILYQFECDPYLNCKGLKGQLIDGKNSEEPLTVDPATVAVGRLGQRDLFVYKTTDTGFLYQFISYKLENDKLAGMKLECHE